MRLLKLLAAVLLTVWAGGAHAQAWIEYKNTDWRFAVNFPQEPTVEEIEWITEDDTAIPARKFTATRGNNIYSVIVADYRGQRPVTILGAEAHTAANYRKLGEVTYDAFSQIDRVSGLQLQITKPDGRRLFLAIHPHEDFLYIGEADVAPRAAPPGQFQQSLQVLDENGVRIRYTPDGERLLSTEHLNIDPALISDRSLYVEDGFVTEEQYQQLLQHAH